MDRYQHHVFTDTYTHSACRRQSKLLHLYDSCKKSNRFPVGISKSLMDRGQELGSCAPASRQQRKLYIIIVKAPSHPSSSSLTRPPSMLVPPVAFVFPTAFVSCSAEPCLEMNVNNQTSNTTSTKSAAAVSQSKVQGPSHQLKSGRQSVQPFREH